MTQSLETLLAVLGLTGLIVGVPLAFWAWVDRNIDPPDVGVDIFVEDYTPLHDCDGCDECGAPMVVDEQAEAGIQLAYYGTRVVHRQCLTARRDNGTVCGDCAKILAAVTL